LTSTNISLDPKGDTPSSSEKVASRVSSGKEKGSTEQGMGKGKEIDDSSPASQLKRKVEGYTFLMRFRKHQESVAQSQGQLPRDFLYLPCIHGLLIIHLKEWMKIRCSQKKNTK
jgi:hypothetical protein